MKIKKGNVNPIYSRLGIHSLLNCVNNATSRAQLIEIYKGGRQVLNDKELEILIQCCKIRQDDLTKAEKDAEIAKS